MSHPQAASTSRQLLRIEIFEDLNYMNIRMPKKYNSRIGLNATVIIFTMCSALA
jgi:hypothetical protein